MPARAPLSARDNPDQQLGLWPEFDQLYGTLEAVAREWREGAWVVTIRGEGLTINLTPHAADALASSLVQAASMVHRFRGRRG